MTRILTIIALLFATPAWAETVMKCDGFFEKHIYRHQNNFFSAEVERRLDGKWTEWCFKDEGERISVEVDIFEDGAVCKVINYLGKPRKKDEYGYRKGDRFIVRNKTTLDFRFRTRVVDFRPLKPDLTKYEPEKEPELEANGRLMRDVKFDCEKM